MVNFTPLKNFHDTDLRSDYLVGLNYTVREGNERLTAKLDDWLAEGKVRLGVAGDTKAGESRIKGAGSVQDRMWPLSTGGLETKSSDQ